LRQLCEAVRAYIGANCFITALEMRQTVETRVISSCEAVELRYPAGEDNLTLTLSQTRQTRLIHDVLTSTDTRVEAAAFGAVALLSVPLISDERFVGTINALQADGFSDAQITKLEGIAGQIALVIDNLELLYTLKSESERLEDVLENLSEGVLVLEDSASDSLIPELLGNRVAGSGRANAAARGLLGISERFSLPQLPAQVRATLEHGSSSLNLGEQRFEVLTKRSAQRTVVVLQDVSAFDAAQRSKAEFLGVVSHELRTPLTSILGFIDLMLSGAVGVLSLEQEDFLQTTQVASQTLFQTVQNLLIASNLEAGLFELRPIDVRLNLAKRLDRFALLAAQKKLGFHLELPAPQRVYMDVERIGLVLDNLVSNAVRYTPSGGQVRVHARVRGAVLESGAVLEVSVSDSGGGLRPEQEQQLFQKFSRDAQNAKQGAGIALYVAKAIVQASGGRLWSENSFGHGLTMHFAVPLETVSLEPSAARHNSSDPFSPKLN
jgi:signal transduction histidine kinase